MNITLFYPYYLKSTGVCTDTRKVEKGNVFIALRGDNFNGNEYATQAIHKGALACIVDEKQFEDEDKNIFYVKNGLKFLQDLAHFHRLQCKIPFIALTGSNGKTTTKELIATCLEPKFKVAYTYGNLNNHIGVPLTLLNINATHEIAVIEMGANHLNEIAELCAIIEPDYGYITNFGKAHLEGFGSEDGVIRGKSELYEFLKKTEGTAFVNHNDAVQIKKTAEIKKVSFGFDQNADYNFTSESNEGLASIGYKTNHFKSNLSGNYNESNIAAAATIAMFFGISPEQISHALANYLPHLNRSQEIKKDGVKILMDAYNANPTSMEAALRNFGELDGSKTVILGDMFELGKSSDQEHHAIAKLATTLNFDDIILIGEEFQQVKLVHPNIHQFRNKELFADYLADHPITTDRILIKGSRGMALEKLLEYI